MQKLPCGGVFALLRVFDPPVAEDVQVMAEVGMMVDEPLPTPVDARRQIKIDPILLTLGQWFARAVERDGPRHSNIHDRAEQQEDDELGKTVLHGNILRRFSTLVWFSWFDRMWRLQKEMSLWPRSSSYRERAEATTCR